ncbi:MAG TPA: response regulator [Anaeromyxobacteraceae bacterium]|nr:response regulator [Anaeromyxobacteraceae bacterium]
MAGTIELAAVFDRASGERLLAAERLVLALPQLFRGQLVACDLHYRSSSRFLVVVARLGAKGYGSDARARLAFWTARAGGLPASLASMSLPERRVLEAHLSQCDLRMKEVAAQDLFGAMGKVLAAAGAPSDRRRDASPRPVLAMDAGGPGWEGVGYDREKHTLFIPGALAPPVGDELSVSVRLRGQAKPLEARARVAQVRSPEEAGPGAPAGFTLLLVSPPAELELALGAQARAGEAQRAAPRYPVKAPVKVTAAPASAARPAHAPGPTASGAAAAKPAGKAPPGPAAPGPAAAPVPGKPWPGPRPGGAPKPASGQAPAAGTAAARPAPAPGMPGVAPGKPSAVAAKPAAAARQAGARSPPAPPASPDTAPGSPEPAAAPSAPGVPGSSAMPASGTARIEYASEQELASDYVENLSQGGAFVRSRSPPSVGTRLTLEMRLPGMMELAAPATVVFVHDYGFGVKFDLDAAGQEKLAAVIARISARPRRALVVDDDGLVRRILSEALQGRGFEVLTARDGAEGLHLLAEELLTLDVLVTDDEMPGMDGEALVRAIREQGGEEDLTIVVAATRVDQALERRMVRAGVDAVVDKSVGPELVAQAADAALERKRLAG